MIPVVSVARMREIDATSGMDESTLVARAGYAVARAARQMMGGTYGRRVIVVAGKGNNGADGRVAAAHLERAGAQVAIVDPGIEHVVKGVDLVIDAAYGTGFHGQYFAPATGDVPVLAVDIPSGVDGDTGSAANGAMHADRTVTFAALKPGIVYSGSGRCGSTEVVDIGLGTIDSSINLVEESDVASVIPDHEFETHKWKTAVAVIGGSPGMLGAPSFAVRGAARAGAGMVRLGIPGVHHSELPVGEAVADALPLTDWASAALGTAARTRAVVVGPGLGREPSTFAAIRDFISELQVPLVIDADGLLAFAEQHLELLAQRSAPTILTPHDGEFSKLCGEPPTENRWQSAIDLAKRADAVVLLKGSVTTVADPEGRVLLTNTGDSRLATAGSGDVLSGIVGAFLAQGLELRWAAAAAAFVHGSASQLGYNRGLVASDLPNLVASWLSFLTHMK